MKILLLFGPPGCGKGTQAENIVKTFGYAHYSTGDMLRKEVKEETEIGKKVTTIMNRGELVSDEIVIEIIKENIKNDLSSTGIIFDGFPRTLKQVESLETLLKEFDFSIHIVISLKVDEKELTRRILERGKTSGRTDDQSQELIAARVSEYTKKTAVLESFYKKKGLLKELNGMNSIENVFYDIENVL